MRPGINLPSDQIRTPKLTTFFHSCDVSFLGPPQIEAYGNQVLQNIGRMGEEDTHT